MRIDKRLSKITARIYCGRAASGAAVKLMAALALVLFALILPLALQSADSDPQTNPGKILRTSDHFDGHLYFNPDVTAQTPPAGNQPRRSSYGWIRRWIIGIDWPEWKAGKGTPSRSSSCCPCSRRDHDCDPYRPCHVPHSDGRAQHSDRSYLVGTLQSRIVGRPQEVPGARNPF